MAKRVQFSGDVAVESTFANEDYGKHPPPQSFTLKVSSYFLIRIDRTAQEVARLTYNDMMDLLKMKSQWRRDMERMMTERANREEEEQTILLPPPDDSPHHHQQQPSSVFASAQEICT